MKNIFKLGDIKTFTKKVEIEDTVVFPAAGPLHEVYSSYALARDAEWTCRLFVLDMKEEDEEGIGTMVKVHHHSPAAVGSNVVFTAKLRAIDKYVHTPAPSARPPGTRSRERGTVEFCRRQPQRAMAPAGTCSSHGENACVCHRYPKGCRVPETPRLPRSLGHRAL